MKFFILKFVNFFDFDENSKRFEFWNDNDENESESFLTHCHNIRKTDRWKKYIFVDSG